MQRELFILPTGPVSGRPETEDPKVVARREKARIYAQKKRDEAKQATKQVKAASTINQAIKAKIARKALATAKAAKTQNAVAVKPTIPAKKPDDNRLHNLPEDIQKKIMEMAKDRGGWKESVIDIIDDGKISNDTPERNIARAIYDMLKNRGNLINKLYDGVGGGYGDYGDAKEIEYKEAKKQLKNIINQYGEKEKYDSLATSLNVRWVNYKDADKDLKKKMLEARKIRKANYRRILSIHRWSWEENRTAKENRLNEMANWQSISPFFAMQILDNKGNERSPIFIYDGINNEVEGYGINNRFNIVELSFVVKMGSKKYWDTVKKKEKKIAKAKAKAAN